ncbi:MAG: hypothetical protein ACAI44_00085 [Candidatus Sericytochromatia bacterium]
MPFPPLRRRRQRGQALTEYAMIATAVILAFAVSVVVLQQLLAANMGSTMDGLSSPRMLP